MTRHAAALPTLASLLGGVRGRVALLTLVAYASLC